MIKPIVEVKDKSKETITMPMERYNYLLEVAENWEEKQNEFLLERHELTKAKTLLQIHNHSGQSFMGMHNFEDDYFETNQDLIREIFGTCLSDLKDEIAELNGNQISLIKRHNELENKWYVRIPKFLYRLITLS